MDEAILYRNIYMNFTSGNESDRRSIGYVASLPFEKISTYFGFDFQGTVAEKFSSTEIAYIVLPLPTAKIYGVEIGDEIRLELSRENPEETFVVAGYIDSNYMGFAFTNMYNLARYDSMELYNTLLINDGQDQTIKRGLMKTYNSAMYFLIDTDEMLAKTAEQAFDLTNYLTIVSLAVAFAFIFVIINNSLLVFYSRRSDYAKLKVLGVSTKELMKEIIQEVVFSIIVVFTISFGCSFLLIPNLGPFMLYFKYFRTIETGVLPLLSRVGIGSLAFVFSYSFYFFKIRSMNVIQEIKKY
jgi:ABC-type antimicrobial peptide transport system permease subunit